MAPAAPASRAASGGSQPVWAPASIASRCWAKTGIRTSCPILARSVAAGAMTTDAPARSATSAHAFARASPRGPRASGYALKFTRMTGVRIASAAEPVPRYKNAARLTRSAGDGTRLPSCGGDTR